ASSLPCCANCNSTSSTPIASLISSANPGSPPIAKSSRNSAPKSSAQTITSTATGSPRSCSPIGRGLIVSIPSSILEFKKPPSHNSQHGSAPEPTTPSLSKPPSSSKQAFITHSTA